MEKSSSSTLRGEDIEAIRKAREASTKEEDIKKIQEQTRQREVAAKEKQKETEASLAGGTIPSRLNIINIFNLKGTAKGFVFDGRNGDGSIIKDISLSTAAFLEIDKMIQRKKAIVNKQKKQKAYRVCNSVSWCGYKPDLHNSHLGYLFPNAC